DVGPGVGQRLGHLVRVAEGAGGVDGAAAALLVGGAGGPVGGVGRVPDVADLADRVDDRVAAAGRLVAADRQAEGAVGNAARAVRVHPLGVVAGVVRRPAVVGRLAHPAERVVADHDVLTDE